MSYYRALISDSDFLAVGEYPPKSGEQVKLPLIVRVTYETNRRDIPRFNEDVLVTSYEQLKQQIDNRLAEVNAKAELHLTIQELVDEGHRDADFYELEEKITEADTELSPA